MNFDSARRYILENAAMNLSQNYPFICSFHGQNILVVQLDFNRVQSDNRFDYSSVSPTCRVIVRLDDVDVFRTASIQVKDPNMLGLGDAILTRGSFRYVASFFDMPYRVGAMTYDGRISYFPGTFITVCASNANTMNVIVDEYFSGQNMFYGTGSRYGGVWSNGAGRKMFKFLGFGMSSIPIISMISILLIGGGAIALCFLPLLILTIGIGILGIITDSNYNKAYQEIKAMVQRGLYGK